MIWALASHEWRRTRNGLTFWLLLAIGQLLTAWLLFAQLEALGRIAPQLTAAGSPLGATELVVAPTFGSIVLMLLLAVPLLAQGGFAGETRAGRLPVWLSAPAGSTTLVLGRVTGLFIACLPLLCSTLATVAVTGLGVAIDWPVFALGAAMLLLYGLWLCTVVVAVSTVSRHPAAATVLAHGLLLFLWLLDSFVGEAAGWRWAALLPHLEPAFGGVLDTRNLAYFAITGGAATLFTVYRIAVRRGEL
jgi:ABC-type transport system involved in multi-copper enzyme maturation permease subunit